MAHSFFPRLASFSLLTAFLLTGCAADNTAQSSGENPAQSSSTGVGASSSEQSSTISPSATSSAIPSPTQTQTELPGGGQKIFQNRRYVALYGAPGRPALGVLGEQEPAQSVVRVQELVKQYQPYSKEKVYPAFEVIATTASSVPGTDGDYSDEATVKDLKPLIEEAAKNDVYVVLDFQPGRSDFLSQVVRYEELLKLPNVGVGIDPEWRLLPWQVHLQQIGSVQAAEVNQTLDYLAQLTRENKLPQKMVVLHQFTGTMITERETLNTAHPELALTLHADGHGTPSLKTDTYNTLLAGLSKDIKPSWKNFYDEDTPMLTPEQTYALTPKPWVVTYQ